MLVLPMDTLQAKEIDSENRLASYSMTKEVESLDGSLVNTQAVWFACTDALVTTWPGLHTMPMSSVTVEKMQVIYLEPSLNTKDWTHDTGDDRRTNVEHESTSSRSMDLDFLIAIVQQRGRLVLDIGVGHR